MGRMILGLAMGLGLMSTAATAEIFRTHEVIIHISDVFVPSEKSSDGNSYVVVSGMFPSSCYRWSRAEVAHPGDNVHHIRSIAMVNDGMCLTVMVPYSKEVVLGRLQPGEHTLRFLNGDETYFERTITVK